MGKSIGRNDRCFCGSGIKYKHCCGARFSIHPDSLVGRLIRMYSVIERLQQQALSRHAFPCKPGCSDCCKGALFSIGPTEYDYLKYGLTTLNAEQLLGVLERTEALSAYIEQTTPEVFDDPSGLLPGVATIAEWEAAVLIREQVFIKAGNITCPLLVNDRCLLYQYRPITCRMYGHFLHKGGVQCRHLKDADFKNQIEVPQALIPPNALGLWYVGRPIIQWLYEDTAVDLAFPSFNRDIVLKAFETPATKLNLHGGKIGPSSLDAYGL